MGLSPRRYQPVPGGARGGCLVHAAAPSTGAGPRGGGPAARRKRGLACRRFATGGPGDMAAAVCRRTQIHREPPTCPTVQSHR